MTSNIFSSPKRDMTTTFTLHGCPEVPALHDFPLETFPREENKPVKPNQTIPDIMAAEEEGGSYLSKVLRGIEQPALVGAAHGSGAGIWSFLRSLQPKAFSDSMIIYFTPPVKKITYISSSGVMGFCLHFCGLRPKIKSFF